MKMATFDPTKPVPDGAELYHKLQKVVWWAYDQEKDKIIFRYTGVGVYFFEPPKDFHLMVPTTTRYVNLYLTPWGKIFCKTFDTLEEAFEDINKINEDTSYYTEILKVAMEVEV